MPDDYKDHMEQARDLLELAAQSPEGRTAIRDWAAEATAAFDQQEAAGPAGQDSPRRYDKAAT